MKTILLSWYFATDQFSVLKLLCNEHWYSFPPIFTTKSLSEHQQDYMVHVWFEQMKQKIMNHDFVHVQFIQWEWYWWSRYFDSSNDNIILITPEWRVAYENLLRKKWEDDVTSIFMTLSQEESREELENRWLSAIEVTRIMEEFSYIKTCEYDHVLEFTPIKLVSFIHKL